MLLANTSTQAKSQLHNLELVARGISLCINSNKTEVHDGTIFSLNGKPLKLVDPLIYLGSKISSTKSNVEICMSKSTDCC